MKYDERKTVIFEWLFGPEKGQLRSYEAPEFLSPDRRRDEINNMVEDINSEIYGEMKPSYLSYILGLAAADVRKRHRGRKWPTINTFCMAVKSAQERAEPREGNSCGQMDYDFARRWWQKFGEPAPQLKSETTERLLKDGVLTLSDAFKSGFQMGGGTHDKAKAEFLAGGALERKAQADQIIRDAGYGEVK